MFSTAPDYITFLRALLAGGGGVLKPATVALMADNHMGDLNVAPLTTYNPQFSNDAEFFPGMDKKWGLTFMINTQDTPSGRSAGSLAWAGINNTYFWLDLNKRVAGVLMTQILPFADPKVLLSLAMWVVYVVMIFIRRHAGLRGRRAVYLSGFVFLIVLAVWAANQLSVVHRFKTP